MTKKEDIYKSGIEILLGGLDTHYGRLTAQRTKCRRRRGLSFLLREREINGEMRAISKVVAELYLITEEIHRAEHEVLVSV